MALAHVQSIGANSSGSVASLGVTFAGAGTSGNLIAVGMSFYENSASTFTVTDSAGNTYTEDIVSTSSTEKSAIAHTYATTGATLTITVTPSVSHYISCGAAEYSGASGTASHTASGNGTGTTANAGSVTPDANGALIFAVMTEPGTDSLTPDGGFTTVFEYESGANMPVQVMYQIQGTAGAINPGWTIGSSRHWSACAATFEAAGGGVTLPLCRVNAGLGAAGGGPFARANAGLGAVA